MRQYVRWSGQFPTLFRSSTDRLLSDPELSATESPLADKKAPGSERAAERAAAQQNSERARLASQPPYVHMQVMQVLQQQSSKDRELGRARRKQGVLACPPATWSVRNSTRHAGVWIGVAMNIMNKAQDFRLRTSDSLVVKMEVCVAVSSANDAYRLPQDLETRKRWSFSWVISRSCFLLSWK